MTEREWDKRLHIKTIGREDESDANCSPYEPTPYSVLERLADSGHVTRKSRLLDYGCGKGRAAIFLAARTGCAAEGVDRSGKLIAVAEANRAGCPCPERVRFIHASAEGFRLTDGRCVLANYDMNFVIANGFTTRPYELRVYLFE